MTNKHYINDLRFVRNRCGNMICIAQKIIFYTPLSIAELGL